MQHSLGNGEKCRLCSNPLSEGFRMVMIKSVYFVLSAVKVVGSSRISRSDLHYSKSLIVACGELIVQKQD